MAAIISKPSASRVTCSVETIMCSNCLLQNDFELLNEIFAVKLIQLRDQVLIHEKKHELRCCYLKYDRYQTVYPKRAISDGTKSEEYEG
jgi:hypothetical protein